ncbi:hypothetical protein [Flagellimonas meishanensis]|uniref:hypothetical protein n=1 Tax=Flagellimonas meishanensis TaxID=2873264 RepID=UPI001CA750F0|nr:hypothetical protein [[Muricauda] meishanensis]
MNLSDIFVSDESIVESFNKSSIVKPENGYSHVYIYCAKLPTAKVLYNGEKLIYVKKGAYFLHKVKADMEHIYSCKRNKEHEKLRITPESGEVIFIHPVYNDDATQMQMGETSLISNGIKLKLRDDKISIYAVESMGKELKLK